MAAGNHPNGRFISSICMSFCPISSLSFHRGVPGPPPWDRFPRGRASAGSAFRSSREASTRHCRLNPSRPHRVALEANENDRASVASEDSGVRTVTNFDFGVRDDHGGKSEASILIL
jgi:hypothetical protein